MSETSTPDSPPRASSRTATPEPGAEWARRPERSNYTLLRVMTWISLRLGRPVGRVVLLGIAAYFLAFSPSARRASRSWLARALQVDVRRAFASAVRNDLDAGTQAPLLIGADHDGLR